MKVLVAEDEAKVRSFVEQALERAGMVVDAVSDRQELLTALQTSKYDILVLDRLLHGEDSLDFLVEIRRKQPEMSVLILSALSEVEEKVQGLKEGADDYLGKPFHVSELIARLQTLSRRGKSADRRGKDTHLTYGELTIDLERQRVTRQERTIDLTGKEFRLLCLLARNPGRIFSKVQILDRVWDMNHFPESNVVEVTIANLRAKIDKGLKPLIQSRRGVGYWLGEP